MFSCTMCEIVSVKQWKFWIHLLLSIVDRSTYLIKLSNVYCVAAFEEEVYKQSLYV